MTWGHFLANLGIGLGDDYLILNDGRRLFEEEGRTLKFVVNGFAVPGMRNRIISSGDRVLISYGPEDAEEVTRTPFPRVASNAEEFNERQDPAGCAGAQELSTWERTRGAFWGYTTPDEGYERRSRRPR